MWDAYGREIGLEKVPLRWARPFPPIYCRAVILRAELRSKKEPQVTKVPWLRTCEAYLSVQQEPQEKRILEELHPSNTAYDDLGSWLYLRT